MGWKDLSYTKKGIIIGVVIFLVWLVIGYNLFGRINQDLALYGKIQCITLGGPVSCLESGSVSAFFQNILSLGLFFGLPLILICTLIGWIIGKFKRK